MTLAGILDFEAQQAVDQRERQDSLALRQGLSHGTWLMGVRKKSLVDSIVNRSGGRGGQGVIQ